MSLSFGVGYVHREQGEDVRGSVTLSFEREPFVGADFFGMGIRHWLLDVELGATPRGDVDLTVRFRDTNWIGVYVRGGVSLEDTPGLVAGAGVSFGRDPTIVLIPLALLAAAIIAPRLVVD
jgi:hypothetical protein